MVARVDAQSSGRTWAHLTIVVPPIELGCRVAQHREPLRPLRERAIVRVLQAEVLACKSNPRLTGQRAVGVDDRAADLGVVRPRATVEVVGADGHPMVVDDAHLRVDVNGRALVVLEVVHRDSIATGTRECTLDPPPPEATRGTEHPGRVRVARDHEDTVQLGVLAERSAQRTRRVDRPQVLIFDVDQRARDARTLSCRRGRCCARLSARTDTDGAARDTCAAPARHADHRLPASGREVRDRRAPRACARGNGAISATASARRADSGPPSVRGTSRTRRRPPGPGAAGGRRARAVGLRSEDR